jgi:hypothetical protein
VIEASYAWAFKNLHEELWDLEGNGMEYFEFKPDSSAKAEASLFLGYHSQVAALI